MTLWQLSSDLHFIYVSPNDIRQRGFLEEEVIGKHLFEFLPESSIKTFKENFVLKNKDEEEKLNQLECNTFVIEQFIKSGGTVWTELVINPLLDSKNEIICYHGVCRDISQRKKFEQAIIDAMKKAEEANMTKSRFLANMSHEIRTPLHGVISFLTLLQSTEIDEEQKGYVSYAKTSGESLLYIINDILDLSKIEAGGVKMEKVDFSLKLAVEHSMKEFYPNVKEKGIYLGMVLENDVPEMVKGDPRRLQQILRNLLSNAIKFLSITTE